MTTAPSGRTDRHDPWWDLDGRGVRRARTRHRIVGALAFLAAVAACGGAAYEWAVRVGLMSSAAPF